MLLLPLLLQPLTANYCPLFLSLPNPASPSSYPLFFPIQFAINTSQRPTYWHLRPIHKSTVGSLLLCVVINPAAPFTIASAFGIPHDSWLPPPLRFVGSCAAPTFSQNLAVHLQSSQSQCIITIPVTKRLSGVYWTHKHESGDKRGHHHTP